jgi:hypothetical protein
VRLRKVDVRVRLVLVQRAQRTDRELAPFVRAKEEEGVGWMEWAHHLLGVVCLQWVGGGGEVFGDGDAGVIFPCTAFVCVCKAVAARASITVGAMDRGNPLPTVALRGCIAATRLSCCCCSFISLFHHIHQQLLDWCGAGLQAPDAWVPSGWGTAFGCCARCQHPCIAAR